MRSPWRTNNRNIVHGRYVTNLKTGAKYGAVNAVFQVRQDDRLSRIDVSYMMLMYLLFALMVSTVLTALVSARIPRNRKGETFIGFLSRSWFRRGRWMRGSFRRCDRT